MRVSTITAVWAFVSSLVMIGAPAQSTQSKDFLIEPNRPIAYLHVNHIGSGPSEEGKSQQRVWLEFHNNSALSISIHTFGTRQGALESEVGVMDILVPNDPPRIIISTNREKGRASTQKPIMPPDLWGDVGSLSTIAPGGSILFSLPASHFSKFWAIRIPFSFDLPQGKGPRDDNAWGGEVEMALSFSFWDLPAEIQKAFPASIGSDLLR